MSAGREGGGEQAEAKEEGGKGARAASGRGLISDIPLCVVIPAPTDRPMARAGGVHLSFPSFLYFPSLTFPSAPMALSLFLRTLQPISSLSLSAFSEGKHCCSFIAIQFYTNLGGACRSLPLPQRRTDDGTVDETDFNQL